MKRLLFVAGAVLSVAALADTPPPRQFAVLTKVGQAYNYDFNMKMSLLDGSGAVSMSATLKETLIGTAGNAQKWNLLFGVTKIADSGLFKGIGAMLQQLDHESLLRVATPENQTISMTANGKTSPTPANFDLVFPKKAISVGEAWRTSVDVKGTPAIMTFRFDGYGKYNSRPAARFSGTFEPNGLVQTLEPYAYYIDMADGKPLHARGAARITKDSKQLDLYYELIRR